MFKLRRVSRYARKAKYYARRSAELRQQAASVAASPVLDKPGGADKVLALRARAAWKDTKSREYAQKAERLL